MAGMFRPEIHGTPINQLCQQYYMAKMPQDHTNYLMKLKSEGFEPKVIYDIGACYLQWYKLVRKLWPNARVFCVEGSSAFEELYTDLGVPENYHVGIVSDQDGREVTWWESQTNWQGNSYYKEIGQGKQSEFHYPDSTAVTRSTLTLDTIAKMHNWPPPDFVKMDVQGAEIDVLRGSTRTLKTVQHLLLELPFADFNEGAIRDTEAIEIVERDFGFKINVPKFNIQFADADYDFIPVCDRKTD